MVSEIIQKINQEQAREGGAFEFEIGDQVRVHMRIKEGGKERIQIFAGIAIGRRGHGSTESFTVRRISHGVGVEKVLPVHSPYIEKVEVERSGHTRRAKLYFLRDLAGKKARLREKNRR